MMLGAAWRLPPTCHVRRYNIPNSLKSWAGWQTLTDIIWLLPCFFQQASIHFLQDCNKTQTNNKVCSLFLSLGGRGRGCLIDNWICSCGSCSLTFIFSVCYYFVIVQHGKFHSASSSHHPSSESFFCQPTTNRALKQHLQVSMSVSSIALGVLHNWRMNPI
jgi:hypothetical protein